MPAWPLGRTYTKGLLGIDQRTIVERQVEEASARTRRMDAADRHDGLRGDQGRSGPDGRRARRRTHAFRRQLRGMPRHARHRGQGFPDLTAGAWLWGGDPETVAETLRVGINSSHDETRVSQMLAFGRDATLNLAQIGDVVAYVQSLGGSSASGRRFA